MALFVISFRKTLLFTVRSLFHNNDPINYTCVFRSLSNKLTQVYNDVIFLSYDTSSDLC